MQWVVLVADIWLYVIVVLFLKTPRFWAWKWIVCRRLVVVACLLVLCRFRIYRDFPARDLLSVLREVHGVEVGILSGGLNVHQRGGISVCVGMVSTLV